MNNPVYKKTITYTGVLDIHWETGYEDFVLLHLYVDGHETINPKYSPDDPNLGPSHFRSYEGILTLNPDDQIEIIESPTSPQFNNKVFTIGNKVMGSKDNFRFGKAYPKDSLTLKEWISLFQGNTRAKVHKIIKSVNLYGGTFDPVHKGHLSIINEAHYGCDQLLVLVGNNWTKNNSPIFSIDERINSVKAITKNFLNVEVLEWAKTEDTSSTFDMAKKIKEIYGFYPKIVIGSDNVEQLPKWKHWDQLKELQFLVVDRKGVALDLTLLKTLKHNIIRGYEQVSSTEIRNGGKIDLIPSEAQKCLDLGKIKK